MALLYTRRHWNNTAREYVQSKISVKLLPHHEVHHADLDWTNNSKGNLVVCDDRNYHILLHQRTEALNATGHVTWKRCMLCKVFGDPEDVNMRPTTRGRFYHSECMRNFNRERRCKDGYN